MRKTKNDTSPAVAGASIPEAADTLGYLLRAAYEKLTDLLYGGLEELGYAGVRPAHSAVIRYLPESGARLTDLAARAGMTKQSMAYLVGHLEQHGYLSVATDPKDARARIVRLTNRGKKLAGAMVARSRELEAVGASRIGKTAMSEFRRNLGELRKEWSK